MARVLVTYYSRTGNTRRLAELFAETLKEEGVEVDLKPVSEVKPEDLEKYDGIAIGSPTYYGLMASEVKKLIDDSVKIHGRLDGKVGAAFTSAGGYSTGAETTILSIISSMLVHGMIVQGDPDDYHYGVAVKGKGNRSDIEAVRRKAKRMAHLLKKLTSGS
ncbi:MAG: flavodoxin domain-containing protein [Candidatus Bathyarchaeia archaeon]|nr:NAD(P)H-dependent oxidoreductase [Candidatus Bathyarchaeota archaeon]